MMINLHSIQVGISIPDVVKAVAWMHPSEVFVYLGEKDRFYTLGTDSYSYKYPGHKLDMHLWKYVVGEWCAQGSPEPTNIRVS